MFEGSNSIELNEATMMKALQYWFDNVMFKENTSPSIVNIRTNNINNNHTFIINVKQVKFEDLVKTVGAK